MLLVLKPKHEVPTLDLNIDGIVFLSIYAQRNIFLYKVELPRCNLMESTRVAVVEGGFWYETAVIVYVVYRWVRLMNQEFR